MKTRFFHLAKRMAQRHSDHHVFRLGSVLVQKNRVVSVGVNRKGQKTHPKSPNIWKSIHAEFDAIVGIPHDRLLGSTIYVARVTKTGKFANSRPCVDCLTLLQSAGIEKICYIHKQRFCEEKI